MAKAALGRGLGELLGEVESAYESNNTSSKENSNYDIYLDVNSIKPNPAQPRKIFDEEKLKELSESIKEHGLIQAITVVESNVYGEYILIAGERRLRAHKLANIDKIKATIMDLDETKLREVALIENIQRDDLNIIELAYSYAQLINEHSLTHDELSAKVFKSRTSITNTLRLLQLSSYVQQMLANEKITAGHAKVMIGLDDETQKRITDSIIGQKLSVRETEQLIKDIKQPEVKTSIKAKSKPKTYDLNPLNTVVDELSKNNLKVKLEKNCFKIEIKSQEDIEKISNYFRNTL
jgi:ParB family chromosome partitioning protein